MLNRLKTLPLTILLTILIWMYAEAQFTITQPEVHVDVPIASGSPDFVVRSLVDSGTRHYSDTLSFVVTLQGPKGQIDQIVKESQGGGQGKSDEQRLRELTFSPSLDQLRQAVGGEFHPYVLPLLNRLEYFRSRGVTVTFARPDYVSIEVDSVARLRKDAVFQSSLAVDSATLDPVSVEVQIPSQSLRAIGEGRITVRAVPQNDQALAALPPETDQKIAVRYVADYPGPRDDRIRIVPGQGNATVRLRRTQQGVLNVNDVPIWISGPPALLARYDAQITPRSVSLLLSGPTALMESTRQRLTAGPLAAGISAYLDLTPDDRPTSTPVRRSLRYIIPEGLTLVQAPTDASFKLTEIPASAPAASSTAPSVPPNNH